MSSEWPAAGSQGPRPRVVPEVLEALEALEALELLNARGRPEGFDGALAAWRWVMARLSAPAFDAGRLAAALELGGLTGRASDGCGRGRGRGRGQAGGPCAVRDGPGR